MHVNIFDTKTDEELILLYNQFLEAEKMVHSLIALS